MATGVKTDDSSTPSRIVPPPGMLAKADRVAESLLAFLPSAFRFNVGAVGTQLSQPTDRGRYVKHEQTLALVDGWRCKHYE